MNTIFENTGRTFTKQGDYLLPDLTIANEGKAEIGVWGQRHKRYLKGHHRVRYYNLLTSGKMNTYLADIEEQAEKMFEQTVKLLAKKENVTEILKANAPMEWVQKMNNIRARATEIVNTEVVFV